MTFPTDRAVGIPMVGPFQDRAAVAIVGESLADVAREALKIAHVEAQSRPVLLVDLLGEGSALDEMFGDDDHHGVSDAAHFGVSLARVARPVPNVKSLFTVPGGAESALTDDVLSDHLWRSWSDQCRRAGALLVVAAPADLPSVGKAIDQLDGLVMIGDSAAPVTNAPVIGRVPAIKRRAVVEAEPPRSMTPAEIVAVQETTANSKRRAIIVSALAVVVVGGALTAGWANNRIFRGSGDAPTTSATQPIVMPGSPVGNAPAAAATLAVGAAPWSVEIASVNSLTGAMARVRQALDSLPVPTFAATQPGEGAATWYHLLAGAFATREEADSLLTVLRGRGALGPSAGRIVRAPLAWQLEEGVPDEQLAIHLFGWRQRGLPAYGLVDRDGNTRIYFGAFTDEAEAMLLSPMLDSLNLYATLETRIGSIR